MRGAQSLSACAYLAVADFFPLENRKRLLQNTLARFGLGQVALT